MDNFLKIFFIVLAFLLLLTAAVCVLYGDFIIAIGLIGLSILFAYKGKIL